MKRTKNIIKSAVLAGAALMAASCQDWLTIYPQTQIVEENFWEDKNDLEGVRYAAYGNMCANLNKMILWGDLRSDSYTPSNACTNTGILQLYQEIRDGQLDKDSASWYFEWNGFYTTINYCNKVLQHGEEVLERDKQFTNSEWIQMRAEMTTLRAMNYFYLLRSFKDIPYSTKVINKDTEVEYFGASNQLDVLDSLITDVESVQGQARVRFTNNKETKGMITNSAIYALLSDMYLWRASLHHGRGLMNDTVVINNVEPNARIKNLTQRNDSVFVAHSVKDDYKLAMEYADLAMASLARQNLEAKKGFNSSKEEMLTYGLNNIEMYKNRFESFIDGNPPTLTAYKKIFSEGNSDESIFELQFNNVDNRGNGAVTQLWGYNESVILAVSDGALGAIYTDNKERNRDSRIWFSAWDKTSSAANGLPGYYCFKWQDITANNPENHECASIKVSTSTEGNNYRNWIVYRLSDMMLQKAEAAAVLAALNENKTENIATAMQYVNAIHRRWYCNDDKNNPNQPSESVDDNYGKTNKNDGANYLGNAPVPTQKTDKADEKYEIAVLNERQLEFIGEGKRWFDLVRYAERHAGGQDGTKDEREWTEDKPIGSGKTGVDLMVDNFLKNQFNNNYASLKNRFKNRYGLYNIIHYMEIKASVDKNGVQHLEQNPVWNKSKYD